MAAGPMAAGPSAADGAPLMPDTDLLHNPAALAEADRGFLLPAAASAGAQVRAVADQLAGLAGMDRPRAMVVVGARAGVAVELLTALAGSHAPAPILAAGRLPGWIGALDVVVVLAAAPDDEEAVRAGETARHRGAAVVVRGAAFGPVALAAAGDLLVPGIAVPEAMAGCGRFALVTGVAAACGLLRTPDWAAVADLLDAVALACHPGAESFVNPAIGLAEHLAGGTPLLVGADPAADAIAGHAVAVLAEVAGLAATRIDSLAAAISPALLRRAAGTRDIFADPDEGSAALRTVLITAPELSHADQDLAAARSLRSAVPGAFAVTTEDLGRDLPAPTGGEQPGGGRPDPLACALALVCRFDFAAVYLALLTGSPPPLDGPDGLGRRGTARTVLRPTVVDPAPARDPDHWL